MPRRHEVQPAAPAPSTKSDVLIGVIGAAHGVRGDVRLKSFTGEPSAIAAYGPLHDGTRSFEIETLRPLRDGVFVAHFKGIDDRRTAAALANTPLYVSRDRLGPLQENEFLHSDLIGLKVVSTAGADLGTIVAVLNFGAGDILEIAPPEGETWLIAFTRTAVPDVDLAGGRVIVDPPHEISEKHSDSR